MRRMITERDILNATGDIEVLDASLVTAVTPDANFTCMGAFKKGKYYFVSLRWARTDSGGSVLKVYYDDNEITQVISVNKSDFKFYKNINTPGGGTFITIFSA